MKLTNQQIERVKFLENEHGQLTATAVLADAQATESPLHSLFDWDKDKAAHAHWLDVAREVIRTVKITITTTETTLRAPYYTRDPEAKGEGYRSVIALQRDHEMAREAVIGELNRAAGNLKRARNLATALGLADEVEALLTSIMGLQRQIETTERPAESLAG